MYAIHPVMTADQIAVTAELASAIWNEHFPAIIGQTQVDYMVENLQSAEAIAEQIQDGACYHLLKVDQKPVGYLSLIRDESAKRLMISKIYLRSSTRGQGLGKALLDFAVEEASRFDCTVLWLTVNRGNSGSIEWYLRRGFVITGEINKDIGGGFVMDDYVMEWRIG